MSIAVLKRKANTKYSKNISVGKDGFSINGTIRLKGVVGQTNLAVSVTRTRFKGTHPVGAGGKNGSAYPIIIANSGHCHAEGGFVASDAYPSNVKLSTKNTKGAIINKNKWMHRGYPNYWVTQINKGYKITVILVIRQVKIHLNQMQVLKIVDAANEVIILEVD